MGNVSGSWIFLGVIPEICHATVGFCIVADMATLKTQDAMSLEGLVLENM
eukprot:c56474_g1_i1 orf=96-245(-)